MLGFMLLLLLPQVFGYRHNVNSYVDEVLEQFRTDLNSNNYTVPIGRMVVGGYAMDGSRLGDLTTMERVGDAWLQSMKQQMEVLVNLTIKDMFLEGMNASGPGLHMDSPRITIGRNLFMLRGEANFHSLHRQCYQSYLVSFHHFDEVRLPKKWMTTVEPWMQLEFENISEYFNKSLERIFSLFLGLCRIAKKNNYNFV